MLSKRLILSAATLLTPILAQQNQSAPFSLRILSATNSTLNGSSLFACHEGAAIEGICNAGMVTTYPTVASNFTFNYTDYGAPPEPMGLPGVLTYLLEGANFEISQPMELTLLYNSNLAHPQFSPNDESTPVAFDDKNLLNIQSYVDDTVYPPTADAVKAYYRWYVCTTNTQGYVYETLNWVLGNFPPQNPSCQKVDVQRVFI